MTKIAILGSGGREHALAWKLGLDVGEENILVIPGNGGTLHNHPLDSMDFKALKSFCESKGIDWLVVGPEDPLAQGIYDAFAGSTVKVFGPSKAAAQLEASKIYSKQFMKKYGVATARCMYSSEKGDPRAFIRSLNGQVVVKYDGLAAGKGVTVCESEPEALEAISDLKKKYGKDAPFLLEERLRGREMSVIGITDGKTIRLLLPSQDHKQAYEGDKGPNTGGMGAYCPVPWYTPAMAKAVQKDVIEPTMKGIREEGFEYRGVIYFGIMMTGDGPKVLEYNVRFGDPETEVILPALKSSLAELIEGALSGTLDSVNPQFYPDTFMDVVLASGGYPGRYQKGYEITGLEKLSTGTLLFHAGTRQEQGRLLTNGGRVLNVVARGKNLQEAIKKVYTEVDKIHFQDKYLRRDIGRREGNL
ncbi:MAG: Phosphoribosylamine--glycine ligase [Marinimicrobia bacterium 46_47]|nr:MAG: Phosphoribosylamine--glycine ligase [Marinimicrobia bacterium 46_47]KUK91045.1 MAG: phosphoribosylamine--glycine ligase [Marinimicrobia bacterium 46_43]